VLPFGNSHMPAMNWARPPENISIPMIALGVWMFLVLTLYMENMNAVEAKFNNPLAKSKLVLGSCKVRTL
jgi:hypothetical protein